MTNPEIKVKRTRKSKKSSTEIQMLVESISDQQYDIFDKQVIINSLTKECDISEQDALSIANRVEENLLKSNFKHVASSYIRSLVNQILGEQGYDAWLKYSSLSIPVYDVKQLIEEHNTENSNTNPSPEAISLTLAGQIIKQYSLRECISKDVADAHLKGDIYVHDGDFWALRPYCSGNSVEYIKLNGIKLPNMVHSNPAGNAMTLVNHLQCFATYLQGLFSGAVGMDAVNVFFAPLLEGMTYKEIKQVAQHLIYSFAQLAANRGSQIVFSDFNLFFRVPTHYANTPAVGRHGKYTGKVYKDYENEARMFLKAIFEVAMAGDANGANFPFPKLDVHIDEECFNKPDELVDLMCELNSKRGSAYVIYDRGNEVKISECCRMQSSLTDEEVKMISQHPEEMRFSAIQNVSLILPRIAYKYKKIKDVHSEIDRLVKLSMQAHKDKYLQLRKLLDMGDKGPISFLAKGMDGKPYLRLEECKYLIGMVGMNEMVQCLTGKQMHESEDSFKLALNIMAYINKSVERQSKEFGLKCAIEQSPAESLAMRSAIADLKYYPEASKYIKGDIATKNVYYTNSVHFAYDSHMDIVTRIEKQSKFDPMIQAGSITHLWHGENEPDPMALKKLYEHVLKNTKTVQTADSPDMTVCKDCHTMHKGFFDVCPKCNSTNIYSESRITGYFSKISGWTKGKLAELKDRVRVDFNMPKFISNDNEAREQILFFSKPNCSKCDVVKAQLLTKPEVVEKLSIIDTQTYDGLAVASYYNVDKLPAILKVKGEEIISRLDQEGSFLKWVKDNTK